MSRKAQNRGAHSGVCPSVSVNQNFLTSAPAIARLLSCVDIRRQDHVIEIGPGKGHITRQLIQKSDRVTAVEIDPRLHSHLVETMGDAPGLTLVCRDFLHYRLPTTEYKVVSNLPFNHTTAILGMLTHSRNPPVEAGILLERGAARALCGLPRVDARAARLLAVFDARIAQSLPRTAFHPMPGVDAAFLHLKRKSAPDIEPERLHTFGQFVKDCYSLGFRRVFTARQLRNAFRLAGIASEATPGEVLYIQWLCLFRCYCLYR